MSDPTRAVALGRRAFARLMVDEVTVTREDPDGGGGYDEDGEWVADAVTVYEGPASVKPMPHQDRQHVQAHGVSAIHRYEVLLEPSPAVRVGDLLEVTESGHDGDLVGTEMLVRDVLKSSWQVSRKVVCEEVTHAS